MSTISSFEKLSFEEAVRVIYYIFCRDPKTFLMMMEELMTVGDDYYKSVAPGWYESYKTYLSENKKSKM